MCRYKVSHPVQNIFSNLGELRKPYFLRMSKSLDLGFAMFVYEKTFLSRDEDERHGV